MDLSSENTRLQVLVDAYRRRMEEAEETLRAIRQGEVDALVVSGEQGDQVFTLKDADRPYRIMIEEMKEEPELTRILATIYVDRDSQKGIVIGRNGALLKEIGTRARKDAEKLLGVKVFLQLWVKVKKGWRDDDRMLKNVGIIDEE